MRRTSQQIQSDIDTQSKVCLSCKERKTFDFFTKQSAAPDLKCNICIECLKKYREIKKEHTSRYKKDYNVKKREHIRYKRLLDKYGVTKEWYFEQLNKQKHRCAICQCEEPKGNGNIHFHVDHCHASGKVRGLLCSSCNTGLGNFKDSVELMQKACEYVTNQTKEMK